MLFGNINNYEGEFHTQEEMRLVRGLKSGSLRVVARVATWAQPCGEVAELQGTTPSPEGGSPGVWDLTGVKKTPLDLGKG